MLLPLVVDKAGMVQCNETTTLFSTTKSKVGRCLPCFVTALLLIFVVLLSSFFGVIVVASLSPYQLSPLISVLCQCLPVVLEVATSVVLQHLVILLHLLASC